MEGAVTFFEIVDSTTGAQQGTAHVFFTPDPMPLFQTLIAHGNGCHQYANDEVGPVQYSAGIVRFRAPSYSFELAPDTQAKPGDWLYPGMLNPDFFGAGSTISVTAAGDQVPAFLAKAVGVGELKVTFTESTVRRNQPYTLKFPATNATAWVTITTLRNGTTAGNYRCEFSAKTGSFVVPTRLLSTLAASASSVVMGVGLVRDTVVQPAPRVKIHLLTAHLTRRVLPLR